MAGLTSFRRQRPLTQSERPRSLRDELDQMLTNLWEDGQEAWFGSGVGSLDICESDATIQAKVDLPGVKPDEIDIQLNGSVLTISGQREEEQEDKGKTYHRVERRTGSFSRSITLPCPVEEDEVAAEYRDGVLTITLPKTEASKTRKISVKA